MVNLKKLVMIFVFAIIIPNVKEFRVEKKLEKRAYRAYHKVNNNLIERQKVFKNIKSDHLKIIKAFDNPFDDKKLKALLDKYFLQTVMHKMDIDGYRENFTVYELNVTTNITTPTNFYDFLDHLNRFDNIVKTNFPIQFSSQDGLINSIFKIEVYEVNASSR